MSNPAPAAGPAALFQMLQGHHATAVLSAGIELGVFAAVHGGARDTAAIAQTIQCPERTTRILVDALSAIGLVQKSGTTYALSPLADQHLVPTNPQYIGGMSQIFGSPMMWTAMSHLSDAVKSGGSVLPEHAETPRHPFWETFAKNTAGLSMPSAMAVSDLLKPWLAKRSTPTLLDVAAGSGTYGYMLAKENPTLNVTMLDWPNVLTETRQWATRLGVDTKRVNYIEGDLFEASFGSSYDVVLMSHLFHHFEPSVCQKLMTKAAGALRPGGRVIVHDFLTDGENPAARMFAVTMLGWSKKGEAYAGNHYREWCTTAGLESFEVHPCEGLPTSIVSAEKA